MKLVFVLFHIFTSILGKPHVFTLTRAAVGGSELCPQTQPASGSAWSELQHTEKP